MKIPGTENPYKYVYAASMVLALRKKFCWDITHTFYKLFLVKYHKCMAKKQCIGIGILREILRFSETPDKQSES